MPGKPERGREPRIICAPPPGATVLVIYRKMILPDLQIRCQVADADPGATF